MKNMTGGVNKNSGRMSLIKAITCAGVSISLSNLPVPEAMKMRPIRIPAARLIMLRILWNISNYVSPERSISGTAENIEVHQSPGLISVFMSSCYRDEVMANIRRRNEKSRRA